MTGFVPFDFIPSDTPATTNVSYAVLGPTESLAFSQRECGRFPFVVSYTTPSQFGGCLIRGFLDPSGRRFPSVSARSKRFRDVLLCA